MDFFLHFFHIQQNPGNINLEFIVTFLLIYLISRASIREQQTIITIVFTLKNIFFSQFVKIGSYCVVFKVLMFGDC